MPAKGDGITKRKDGRHVGRYTVRTPDGPRCKVIYGRRYKDVEKKLAEARGDAGSPTTRATRPSGNTWSGGWPIASATPCARGPTNGTRASFGCI